MRLILARVLAPITVLFCAFALGTATTPAEAAEEYYCWFNPGQTCCQCTYGTPFCYETTGGGVYYCNFQVCPYEIPPCWGWD